MSIRKEMDFQRLIRMKSRARRLTAGLSENPAIAQTLLMKMHLAEAVRSNDNWDDHRVLILAESKAQTEALLDISKSLKGLTP